MEAGESLVNLVLSLKSELINEGIRWTSLDNIHITLAFLGDTEENMIKVIDSKLKDKCEGSGKFEVILKGTGAFKSYNDPRVLWTGIELSQELEILNKLIIDAVTEAGITIEGRPFRPHLTLGRVKFVNDKPAMKDILDKYKGIEIQKVPVNEVILYESILLQYGPVYKPLRRYIL